MTDVIAHMLRMGCALVLGGLLPFAARACEQRLTVVELFTSQGCSSCPSADALLGALAARADLLALSEHVDYWDYLGWKDPFASAVNTQRQRGYARLLSVRYVYTPQMVVQGVVQVPGSDRDAVLRAIESAPAATVPIRLSWQEPDRLAIALGAAKVPSPATVWVTTFDRAQTTTVGSGENEGQALHNFNVVRSLTPAGEWSGGPIEMVAYMGADAWKQGNCAVLVQASGMGQVLGAARCGRH